MKASDSIFIESKSATPDIEEKTLKLLSLFIMSTLPSNAIDFLVGLNNSEFPLYTSLSLLDFVSIKYSLVKGSYDNTPCGLKKTPFLLDTGLLKKSKNKPSETFEIAAL